MIGDCPNYDRLRDETGFSWYVSSAYPALIEVTGLPMREFYTDPAAGIELYRKGRPILREMLEPDISLPPLATPPISYGHINGLGARLLFPENGEVNHNTLCDTLERGIEILKNDVDFAASGMAPFCLDYREKMIEAFDGESCGFAYASEGPTTTAYTLRGLDVFYDPYDSPDLFKEFLRLVVESVVRFWHFRLGVLGLPPVNPDQGKVWDDIAGRFSPDMWPEFVLPYLHQYFSGLTTGTHAAHIEDLRADHQ